VGFYRTATAHENARKKSVARLKNRRYDAHHIVRVKTPLLEILRQRGLTTKQLGEAVGLNPRTIHNVACGSSKSRAARQKIANYLGTSPWNDIEVTQRFVTFPEGTEIEYRTAKEARECAADELAAGIVTRRGRVVTFVKAATFIKEIDKPTRNAKTRNRKISGGSAE